MDKSPVKLEDIQVLILSAVKRCLPDTAVAAGAIDLATVPYDDLAGFDSLCAMEFAVEVGDELQMELEDDLFVGDRRKSGKHRSIAEVSTIVWEKFSGKEETSDAR